MYMKLSANPQIEIDMYVNNFFGYKRTIGIFFVQPQIIYFKKFK